MALRKLLGNQVELQREAPEMDCTTIGQSSQLTLPPADLEVVCGSKRYCRQMNSCEEARVFLSQYGLSCPVEIKDENLLAKNFPPKS